MNALIRLRDEALFRSVELRRRAALAREPGPEGVHGPARHLLWGEAASIALATRPLGKSPPALRPQPVVLLPGFGSHTLRMRRLSRALKVAGHRPHDWGQGFNLGPTEANFAALVARIEDLAASEAAPVALVGWSLGGLFAREAAKVVPNSVSCVITMGTPFSGDRRANNAWRAYQMITGHRVDEAPIGHNVSEKPPVPTIALWSSRDGVVSPRASCGRPGERDRAIALRCAHMGFALDPEAIAEVLRQLDLVN